MTSQSTTKPPFTGILIAGLIIPALSLSQARDMKGKLTPSSLLPLKKEDGEAEAVEDFMERQMPIIMAAVRRNYPAESDDDVWSRLDRFTFQDALQAALGFNSLRPRLVEGE